MAPPKKAKKPAERTDLSHKAYMGIRQMLMYNEILPGQKIKYQDLADRLEISITPVIHALKFLEFKNIVRYEHNKGYYVNEANPQEIREIYETRAVLEVAILPQTLINLDDAGIQSLQTALDAFEGKVKKADYYGRLISDMKFHFTLASLSQCRIQLTILEELFDLLFLRYSHNLVVTSISETSLSEHKKIFDSLVSRNLTDLERDLSDHLINVKNHIVKNLDRMNITERESVFDFHSYSHTKQ
jgi:DNA-binding GntR family transcriptional regulator